jgi:hypothetical protein
MTPPRDEDASCDDFAPVIPLRRRQLDVEPPAVTDTLEPDSRGLWDSDAPIPGLPERASRSEQPPAPELPARSPQGLDYIDPNAGEAMPRHGSGSPRRLRRRLALAVSAAAILAAAAAALIVAASGGADTHANHPPTSRSAITRGPAVADARPSRTVTATHAPSSESKTAVRSHRAARRRHRPATHRRAAVSTAVQTGSSNAPAGASLSSVPLLPVVHTRAPVVNSRTPGSGAASSCVPGELGC